MEETHRVLTKEMTVEWKMKVNLSNSVKEPRATDWPADEGVRELEPEYLSEPQLPNTQSFFNELR